MDDLEIAQLIVRGEYINFDFKGSNAFMNHSAIYRFSNENIKGYFHHLENKNNVLTAIGSGAQVVKWYLSRNT